MVADYVRTTWGGGFTENAGNGLRITPSTVHLVSPGQGAHLNRAPFAGEVAGMSIVAFALLVDSEACDRRVAKSNLETTSCAQELRQGRN